MGDVAGGKRQLKFTAYVALVIYRSHYNILLYNNPSNCKPLRHMDSVCITPYILNIGTNGANEYIKNATTSLPEKKSMTFIQYEAGWAPRPSGRFSPAGKQTVQPVA